MRERNEQVTCRREIERLIRQQEARCEQLVDVRHKVRSGYAMRGETAAKYEWLGEKRQGKAQPASRHEAQIELQEVGGR
jgi:hypothetical protein